MKETMRRMHTEKEINGFVLKRFVHKITDEEEEEGYVTIQRFIEDGKEFIPSLFVVVNVYGPRVAVNTILSVVAGKAEADSTHINSYSIGGTGNAIRSEITIDLAQVISSSETIEILFLDTDAPTKAIDY